jgi:hypothetical protein
MASKDTSVVGVWRLVSTRALVDGRASLPEGTPRQYARAAAGDIAGAGMHDVRCSKTPYRSRRPDRSEAEWRGLLSAVSRKSW